MKNMGLIQVDRTLMQYLKLQQEKREKEQEEKKMNGAHKLSVFVVFKKEHLASTFPAQ